MGKFLIIVYAVFILLLLFFLDELASENDTFSPLCKLSEERLLSLSFMSLLLYIFGEHVLFVV